MARKIEASVPTDETDRLVEQLRSVDGVTGLTLQRGASLEPPGDVLTVLCVSEAERTVLRTLADAGVTESGSFHSSRPMSLVSPKHQARIERETSEMTWEEFGDELRHEANPSLNFHLLMVLSGAFAAVGFWVDTAIFVIAAILVAPGFEPLLRIPHGFLTGSRSHARSGALATVTGYAALALGAAVTLLLLDAVGPGAPGDLATHEWVGFWASLSPSGVLLALLGGAAGVITISADRPVLTAGVLVALALIPSMAIAGMGVATWNLELAAQGIYRWAVDVVGILIAGSAVILWKRQVLHRRTSRAVPSGRRGASP